MIAEMGKRARQAGRLLSRTTEGQRNTFLTALADQLMVKAELFLIANHQDVKDGERNGLSPALLDRLTITISRLQGIANDLRTVAALPDPVGEHFEETVLPNGLRVHKQRVPLGVLAVVYEARPNVTLDIAGLAVKTGNAVILRGGKETLNSNRALVVVIHQVLELSGLPVDAVQFIDDPDRKRVLELMRLVDDVDMLIPRGGAALHQFCRENSRIPVITGGIGLCHLFVDESAHLDAALGVIHNAKTQRPTVCNALDTLLVHKTVAPAFLPMVIDNLAASGVTFRAEPRAFSCLQAVGTLPATVQAAGLDDFDTEWLSLILGLKVVNGLDEAIAHIQAHSTGHSDGILTQDEAHARQFIAAVDSAAVYVNASTRFTDGAQLGLGAEVAISTQRLHARGPMGLRELTTYKWVIQGDYHVRE